MKSIDDKRRAQVENLQLRQDNGPRTTGPSIIWQLPECSRRRDVTKTLDNFRAFELREKYSSYSKSSDS